MVTIKLTKDISGKFSNSLPSVLISFKDKPLNFKYDELNGFNYMPTYLEIFNLLDCCFKFEDMKYPNGKGRYYLLHEIIKLCVSDLK